MRSIYPRTHWPHCFKFNYTLTWPTDKEILSWADGYLNRELEQCVKRVINLDSNDEEFVTVLNEPFITRRDIMNGDYPLRGVALAYNLLSIAGNSNRQEFQTVLTPE
jgi:hypothetical protein